MVVAFLIKALIVLLVVLTVGKSSIPLGLLFTLVVPSLVLCMDRCQPAPMPQLPAGDIANIPNPSLSVIMRPMQPEQRPFDEYLGNCRGGLFCSSAGDNDVSPVCRMRYQPDISCGYSSQCYSGKCPDNVCQTGEDRDDDDDDT